MDGGSPPQRATGTIRHYYGIQLDTNDNRRHARSPPLHRDSTLLMPPSDLKKEEFQQYLEQSGVLTALTQVLVGLYEEKDKPVNAVDYIKRGLGAPRDLDMATLQAQNDQLTKTNAELVQTIKELTKRLSLDENQVDA